MKKIFVLSIGIAFVTLNLFSSKREKTNEILLENIEAMAEPEVEIEAICMGTEGLCTIYPNGFFIRGQRVA